MCQLVPDRCQRSGPASPLPIDRDRGGGNEDATGELEVLGDGTQQKPYLHVSELIDAMVFAQGKAQERLNCYNIAPPTSSTTVRYIAEAVVRAVSPKAKIRYGAGSRGWVGDVPRFAYSIAKIQKLGWSPKMTSDEAVDLAIRENLETAK